MEVGKREIRSRTVYYFTSATHALSAVRDQRYKLSRLDRLNDPFELCGPQYTDSRFAMTFEAFKISMAQGFGMLCCSRDWSSMLLWSHYADSHRGIALELEVQNDAAVDVIYTRNRQAKNADDMGVSDVNGSLRLISTKALDWAYEEEVRLFHRLDVLSETAEGHYFCSFGDVVQLRGVVLGALNQTSDADIIAVLPKGSSISVTRTMLSHNSFEIAKVPNGTVKLPG